MSDVDTSDSSSSHEDWSDSDSEEDVFVNAWPSEEETGEISKFFRQKRFPGIVGVIDGTRIKIYKPENDPDSYLNRKYS
ncbi:hypothetical protein ILUMI_19427 [Ignelater luminosus]|uniref:Uncharacterized protein n=1 Tax=Ignelater luminosus TaxID=2038154 RepID=A0A8K0CJC1_IGNLU|nr:hypothetical protein ILUMI_19427 [Ignelater luminosus]